MIIVINYRRYIYLLKKQGFIFFKPLTWLNYLLLLFFFIILIFYPFSCPPQKISFWKFVFYFNSRNIFSRWILAMTLPALIFLPLKVKICNTYFSLAVHLKDNTSRITNAWVRKIVLVFDSTVEKQELSISQKGLHFPLLVNTEHW